MKILALILAVMSWTVTSNKTVAGEGDLPSGVVANYVNTYNKGQVRANDTATFCLHHMESITVESITVYVKSNKTSGAGMFTVEADGQTLSTKSGTLAEWTGAYDNTDYHAVSLFSGSETGYADWTIKLVGTINSLHIDRYVISYTASPAYTVTLMSGAQQLQTLTETEGGAGIRLPVLQDRENWHFTAWTEQPFYTINTMPDSWITPGDYHPSGDCTLWAVYVYEAEQQAAYVSDLQTGTYLYLDTYNNGAITGVPYNGRMSYTQANPYDSNQAYDMVFNPTLDSVTIQHVPTGTYIGYEGKQLAAKQSVWCVYHEQDRTVFYMQYQGKTYVLWPMNYENGDMFAGLRQAGSLTGTTTALMTFIEQEEEPAYTCYPETGRDIESVTTVPQELILPIGNYELRIVNGKKTIRL